MKKIQIWSLVLCLIVMAVLVGTLSCCRRSENHTNNEAASYFYGYSLYTYKLVRYEFNAAGQPLAAVSVDWYTLQPREILSDPTYDRRYEYDHTGRLIGHEVFGASLTIDYDKSGHPVRSVGLSDNNEMVTVEYTCTQEGRILSERVTCQPLDPNITTPAQSVVYTYDEKGRLIGENDHTYHYGENSIAFEFMDEKTPRSVVITLNETGDIQSLACPDDEVLRYDWTYDDHGRCVSSKGRILAIIWTTEAVCQTDWNENGQLIEANVECQSVLPGRSIVDYRYCFAYDGTGAIKQTVVHSISEGANRLRETRDLSDGTLVKYTREDIYVESSGQETLRNWYFTEYDKETGNSLRSMYYQGKDELQTELVQQYDRKGQLQGSVAKTYVNGQLFRETTVAYKYGKQGDVVKVTTENVYHRHGWRTVVVCEYAGGVLVNSETKKERIEATE